jgi:hypothetical protein
MHILTPAAAIALALSIACTAQTVAAQGRTTEPAAKSPALNELDCRTLLRLDGDERAFTLLYLHGFVSGKNNQLMLSTDALATATDRIVDHCIDKPGDKLLAVFEQVRKPR